MNRNPPPPSGPDDGGEDRLLRRYHEANALDDARPAPALREAVLAHARSVVATQKGSASAKGRAPASNDPSWTLRALGSLAVLGLVGLLVLQFDRGSPEEREAAFGGAAAPAGVRPAPVAAPDRQAAGEPATAPEDNRGVAEAPSLKNMPAAPPVPDTRETPAAVTPAPAKARPVAPPQPAAPDTGPAPASLATDAARGSMAEAPAAPAAAPPAERAAPDALTQAAPDPSDAERPAAAEAREPARNAAALRREAPTADRARSAPALPPLLAATAQGDPDTVRRLLAAGADVNTRDAAARTALMLAAQRGDGVMVRLLLQAGADPALRDHQGLSAAEHAARAGHADLLPPANTPIPGRP